MTITDERNGGPVARDGATAPRALGWTRGDTVRMIVAVAVAVALLVTAGILHGGAGDGVELATALLIGTALGILFERGRFCFYCISRDLFEKQNSRGAYAILTALAVGVAGYTLIFSMRLPNPSPGDVGPGAHVGPLSLALVIAAFAFGIGVVVSHGCIAGHLYRLGEGSMRAVPALLGALIGFGLGFLTWNPIASGMILGAPAPWLPAAAGYVPALVLQLAILVGVGVVLLRWNPPVQAEPERQVTAGYIRRVLFFKRWGALLTGSLVGLVCVISYLRMGPLGVTSQLSSLVRTMTDGTGLVPETLIGLDASLAGCVALVVEAITANGWLIIGIVAGSLAAGLPGRRVRFERVGVRGSAAAIAGGILLGWGAITALGCTVGVFLSGIHAGAASGWVFAFALVAALAVGFRLRLNRY